MIRQIAASPGDEICECTSGSEAVQRVGEFAPDWVTMDLRMPGISGLDATRAIMTVRPSASIVVVSSYDIAELRRAASDAGAKGFVDEAVKSVGAADVVLSTLQDSMLPVEVEALRAAASITPD